MSTSKCTNSTSKLRNSIKDLLEFDEFNQRICDSDVEFVNLEVELHFHIEVHEFDVEITKFD